MEKEHKHHWGYFRDNMMVCNGCSETRTVKEVITELTRNEAITSELVECLRETNGRLKLCQSLLMYRYKNNPELGDTEYQTDERIRKNEEVLAKLTLPTE